MQAIAINVRYKTFRECGVTLRNYEIFHSETGYRESTGWLYPDESEQWESILRDRIRQTEIVESLPRRNIAFNKPKRVSQYIWGNCPF